MTNLLEIKSNICFGTFICAKIDLVITSENATINLYKERRAFKL